MPREDAMGVARFPATQWSLVGRAGHVTGSRRREALGTLLNRYMPAMRTHLVLARRSSVSGGDSERLGPDGHDRERCVAAAVKYDIQALALPIAGIARVNPSYSSRGVSICAAPRED